MATKRPAKPTRSKRARQAPPRSIAALRAKLEPPRTVVSPADLTPGERRQFIGMIGIGVPVPDACHSIGLHPKRFQAWMDERDEAPDVEAFRQEVLQADGRGVAQQIKILWDGGKTARKQRADGTQESVIEISKTVCEQHRFLLARRRPEFFSGDPRRAVQAQPTGPAGGARAEPMEPDVAEQIVAVLTDAGVVLPPEVLSAIGLE